MKIDIITHAIFDDASNDVLGRYDVRFHNTKIVYKGTEYRYHSSGICRSVYVDPNKKFVLKIPIEHCGSSNGVWNKEMIDDMGWKFMEWSLKHNILEALAYAQCPKEFKKYFARTKLINHGWVKQEFVDVYDFHHGDSNFREIGVKKNGALCLFDFDPIIKGETYGSPVKSNSLSDVVFRTDLFESVVKPIKEHEAELKEEFKL